MGQFDGLSKIELWEAYRQYKELERFKVVPELDEILRRIGEIEKQEARAATEIAERRHKEQLAMGKEQIEKQFAQNERQHREQIDVAKQQASAAKEQAAIAKRQSSRAEKWSAVAILVALIAATGTGFQAYYAGVAATASRSNASKAEATPPQLAQPELKPEAASGQPAKAETLAKAQRQTPEPKATPAPREQEPKQRD